MEKRVRCPHCNLSRVTTQTIYNDDPSFERHAETKRAQSRPWLGCGGLFLVAGLLGSFMVTYAGSAYGGQMLFGLLFWTVVGAGLLFVGLVLRAQGDLRKATVTSTVHHCRLCGYDWEERVGKPGPAYRPAPPDAAMARRYEEVENEASADAERRRRLWHDPRG